MGIKLLFQRLMLGCVMLVSASQLWAVPNGQQLFNQNCASCHHLDGTGGIGLPLIAQKLEDVSDRYLFKTIRNGRPGRIMPAFQMMSDAQVNAIVGFLRKASHTKGTEFDQTPLLGNVEKGQWIFEQNCQRCHGANGTGEGLGTGVTMSRKRQYAVMPPAISNYGFQNSASDRMIHHIITKGRPESGMPPFGKMGLSENDITDVVVYVRKLGAQAKQSENISYEDEPLSHMIESSYDFETTVTNVRAAVTGANFRTFPDRFLEQGLFDEFTHNQRQIGIRFCNFKELYGMLAIEPRLGVVLPCRVTIMEQEDGQVVLVIPNLRVVSRWFNNDELISLWETMEETLTDIVDEATL